MSAFSMPGRNSSPTRRRLFAVVWFAVFVGILVEVPVLRWFLLICLALGLPSAMLVRWWFGRTPVKVEEPEEHNILGLKDDDKKEL